MSVLLECDGRNYSDVNFIEEDVVDITRIRLDSALTNEITDPSHIDLAWTTVDHT